MLLHPQRRLSLIITVLALLCAHASLASRITVTSPGDVHVGGKLTLREAIAASHAGDTIVFAVGPITLTHGEITIAHDLVIRGRPQYLQTGTEFTTDPIESFRLIYNAGVALVTNCTFLNNSVTGRSWWSRSSRG